MSQRVKQLPRGLREDAHLKDGFYVGNRHAEIKTQCATDPKREEDVVGGCKGQPPRSVFIDDEEGDVYVPTSNNEYLKYTLDNSYAFWKRDLIWKDNATPEGPTGKWFKYIWRGADSFSAEEINDFLRYRGISDDLYSAVLDNREDFESEPALLFGAAVHWIDKGEGASRYFPTAMNVAEQIVRQGRLEAEKIRMGGFSYLWQEDVLISEGSKKRLREALLEYVKKSNEPAEKITDLCSAVYYYEKGDGKEAIAKLFWERAKDESRSSDTRFEALKLLMWNNKCEFECEKEIMPHLLSLIYNWDGDGEKLNQAGDLAFGRLNGLGFLEEREELIAFFYDRAQDSAEAEDRYWGWRFLSDLNDYKEEAIANLKLLGTDKRVEGSVRLRVAQNWIEEKADGEKEKEREILLSLVQNTEEDPNVRWKAWDTLNRNSDQKVWGTQKQQWIAGISSLLLVKGLDEEYRRELAADVFFDAQSPEAFSKGVLYYLDREGLDGVLGKLEDVAIIRSPKAALERAQWLLSQYDTSSTYDYQRNAVNWTMKKLRKGLPPKDEAERKMIVTLTQ